MFFCVTCKASIDTRKQVTRRSEPQADEIGLAPRGRKHRGSLSSFALIPQSWRDGVLSGPSVLAQSTSPSKPRILTVRFVKSKISPRQHNEHLCRIGEVEAPS